MQKKTWTNLDRSKWPTGPWDGEPDKVQFQDAFLPACPVWRCGIAWATGAGM